MWGPALNKNITRAFHEAYLLPKPASRVGGETLVSKLSYAIFPLSTLRCHTKLTENRPPGALRVFALPFLVSELLWQHLITQKYGKAIAILTAAFKGAK